MADYDLKDIPILDDIIENNEDDLNKVDNSDASDSGALDHETKEDNFDFFSEDAAENESNRLIEPVNAEIDTSEEQAATLTAIAIDTVIETTDDDKLVFDEDDNEAPASQTPAIEPELNNDQIQIDSSQPSQSVDQLVDQIAALPLEDIVEDVVKQLIPDLEQQLRFLVKQALEDKLPAEITTQLHNKEEESPITE